LYPVCTVLYRYLLLNSDQKSFSLEYLVFNCNAKRVELAGKEVTKRETIRPRSYLGFDALVGEAVYGEEQGVQLRHNLSGEQRHVRGGGGGRRREGSRRALHRRLDDGLRHTAETKVMNVVAAAVVAARHPVRGACQLLLHLA